MHEHDPIYVRGGTTTISLIGGGEPEQVLLMPAAGPAGASQVEACFEFSVRCASLLLNPRCNSRPGS